jgi:glycosyltransferase involved in cell wall biosynthesis
MIRACLFGTYTATHPANRLLARSLEAAGVSLAHCHEPLWERTRDKDAAFFGVRSLARLGLAYAGAARRLRAKFRALPPPDLVVTGFNGQLDVLLARRIAGRKARVVFAPLVTLTETLVDDRRVYRRGGLKGRAASRLDRRTLESADLVLTDTETHRRWIAQRLTKRAKTATLYLGAEPAFRPTPPRRRQPGEPLRVLFYGQYVPLHGTEVIVEAAALLAPEGGIEITMIGTGPERAAASQLAAARGAVNLTFEDWVAYEQLPVRLAACDVALGIFGATAKAKMVIPTKVYQAAAAGRAVVTADTPALREVFTPGEDVLTVRADDPGELAITLRRLRGEPATVARLGAAAGRLLTEHLDARAQGARMRAILSEAFPDLAERFVVPSDAPDPAAPTDAALATDVVTVPDAVTATDTAIAPDAVTATDAAPAPDAVTATVTATDTAPATAPARVPRRKRSRRS